MRSAIAYWDPVCSMSLDFAWGVSVCYFMASRLCCFWSRRVAFLFCFPSLPPLPSLSLSLSLPPSLHLPFIFLPPSLSLSARCVFVRCPVGSSYCLAQDNVWLKLPNMGLAQDGSSYSFENARFKLIAQVTAPRRLDQGSLMPGSSCYGPHRALALSTARRAKQLRVFF
jgi:hypothetical protein